MVFHIVSGRNGRIITEEIPVYGKFSDITFLLGKNYLWCHRSYIINMDGIYAFDGNDVILKTGERITLGRDIYRVTKNICMEYFEKWWQQLFGESEGKDNQGIFSASAIYTTDLHSLGQYMQQGRPNIFETVISFEKNPTPKYTNRIDPEITVPEMAENLDELKYLEGKGLGFINEKAKDATITAHSKHIPVFEVEMPDLSARSLGSLIFFFELACAISAKFDQINPFDQPGVEDYKQEMFRLLGKPEKVSE